MISDDPDYNIHQILNVAPNFVKEIVWEAQWRQK